MHQKETVKSAKCWLVLLWPSKAAGFSFLFWVRGSYFLTASMWFCLVHLAGWSLLMTVLDGCFLFLTVSTTSFSDVKQTIWHIQLFLYISIQYSTSYQEHQVVTQTRQRLVSDVEKHERRYCLLFIKLKASLSTSWCRWAVSTHQRGRLASDFLHPLTFTCSF